MRVPFCKELSLIAATLLPILPIPTIHAADLHDTAYATSLCAELHAAGHTGSSDGFAYRCELIHQLKTRGLSMSSPMGRQILGELLRPWQTVLHLHGEAPLPKSALQYLFQESPDTARLVNFFARTDYRVVYTNPQRSQFFATNNRNMKATVDIIDRLETKPTSNYLMFENGEAKLMFWRFAGKSIVELNLKEFAQQTKYDLKIHIFTNSRTFHFFFESALFRHLMTSMLKRVLRDIVSATQQLVDTNGVFPTINPDFVDDLHRHLKQIARGGSK